MYLYRYWHNSLNGKLVALFINGSLTLGTNTTERKQRHLLIDTLTHQWFWLQGPLCEKGRFAIRVVAMSVEKMEWKWDSSEADARVFGQWPLLAPHGGKGHFVSVAPENAAPVGLPCVNSNAKIPTRDAAEKHGKDHNSESLRVPSALIIPFFFRLQKRQLLRVR